MFHLTEAEVMANWPADEPIRVSICCITYKQEHYISQAIDGFLMQKTAYPFEIIIGEDCGGDCTLKIIEEYQKKYPNIIKVITSEINVGANANLVRIFEAAQGEYIAICEGDDYWIDEKKIQKQVALLEKNEQIDICFTAAKTIDPCGKIGALAKHSDSESVFTISDVVRGGGGFMPTASLLFRRAVIDIIPEWFSTAPIGDYYIQLLGSLKSGALYIPDFCVVYRVNAIGSWSAEKKYETENKILSTLKKLLHCADGLSACGISDEYLKYIKAAHSTDAAVELLMNGYFQEAKEIIVQSWKTEKWIGKMQAFIYMLRFFPKISSFILRLKSK